MRRGRRGNNTYKGIVIRRADPKTVKAGFLALCETCEDEIPGGTQQEAWQAHRRHLRKHMTLDQRVEAAAREIAHLAWTLAATDDGETRAILERAAARHRELLDVEQPWRGEAVRAGVSNDALDRACVDLGARYEYTMAYSETRRFETIRFFGILASSIREGRQVTDRDDNPLDVARLIEYARSRA